MVKSVEKGDEAFLGFCDRDVFGTRIKVYMFGFDFKLDDFQEEAINFIKDGKSVVVCAPTGAGKTCIAESAIHLALESNQRISR